MYDIKQYEHFISIHSHIISFPLACAQTTILYVYFTYVNRLLNYKLFLNKVRCSYKSDIICSLLNDPISQGMFSILFLITDNSSHHLTHLVNFVILHWKYLFSTWMGHKGRKTVLFSNHLCKSCGQKLPLLVAICYKYLKTKCCLKGKKEIGFEVFCCTYFWM